MFCMLKETNTGIGLKNTSQVRTICFLVVWIIIYHEKHNQ